MSDPTPPGHQITCPGCSRQLSVPPAAVGRVAHCPHCKSNFFLPANPDGTPGEPRPVRRDPGRFGVPKPLAGPGFALVIVGLIGALVNGALLGMFLLRPGADLDYARGRVREVRNVELTQAAQDAAKTKNAAPVEPPDTSEADEELARSWAAGMVPLHAASLVLSLLTVAGGLATLAGRFYPLALLGCATAAVNVNNFCCVPGVVAGAWAFLYLVRDEGRDHFRKARLPED